MSLFLFLAVVQAIVAFALVVVVLMQRSEGGGLGIGGGGSPGGLMSARGAADFLTRTTKWLAVTFVGLSIAMAAVAINASGQREIDESLVQPASSAAAPVEGLAPADDASATGGEGQAGAAPAQSDPLTGVSE